MNKDNDVKQFSDLGKNILTAANGDIAESKASIEDKINNILRNEPAMHTKHVEPIAKLRVSDFAREHSEHSIKTTNANVESNNKINSILENLDTLNTDTKNISENVDEVVVENNPTNSLLKFILAIIAGLFFLSLLGILGFYIFSKSRPVQSEKAIISKAEVIVETPKVEPKFIEVLPTTPKEPVVEEVVVTPTPAIVEWSATTTEVRVRFSYDKQTYDTYPRGIYVLDGEQTFTNDYADWKLLMDNRGNANDKLFARDRNKVSLIGKCAYAIDEATVLVENMDKGTEKFDNIDNKYFKGKLVKVISSSKPYIDCKKK